MPDSNAASRTLDASSWDGDPARFTIDQWRNSCLIDRNGDENSKSNYALPVKDPDGRVNRNGLAAAAARLGQVKGISADQRAAAARHLVELYALVGLPAPDSLREMAGSTSRSVTHSGVERRSTPIAVTGNASSREIFGHAAVFGRDSRMIPRLAGSDFVERITPGFFEESRSAGWPGIQGSGVLARFNHSDMHTLGTTRAGTLQLSVDRIGLQYSTEVPKSRDDVLELVARGDITGSSFTFADAQDDWSYSDGVTRRTLVSGTLIGLFRKWGAGGGGGYPRGEVVSLS